MLVIFGDTGLGTEAELRALLAEAGLSATRIVRAGRALLWKRRGHREAAVAITRVRPPGSMAAYGKGFGCRPGASGIPGKRAGVGKPPKNEPAGKR
jgi:hypothetical protein